MASKGLRLGSRRALDEDETAIVAQVERLVFIHVALEANPAMP
jgi:hypothetical protein